MRVPVLLALAAVFFAPLPAGAQQAYKWTDEKGQVHYGDQVPQDKKAVARPIVTEEAPSEKDRKLAEERLARDKDYLKKADAASPASAPPVPAAKASAPRRPSDPSKMTCEEAWKAYNDSYACFDPYRITESRVKLEAFQHCEQVTQPQNCPPPSDH